MINHYSRYSNTNEKFERRLHKYKFFQNIKVNKEFYLILFFLFLFLIILLRLFSLQILNHNKYEAILSSQHVRESTLKAQRGDIYALDKSGKPVKLTENITLYNIFVDPKFIGDKDRFIQLVSPIVYQHLCETYGMTRPDNIKCIKNIETYTNTNILPSETELFYFGKIDIGSGFFQDILSTGYDSFDRTGYNLQLQEAISGFNSGIALGLIKTSLNNRIQI